MSRLKLCLIACGLCSSVIGRAHAQVADQGDAAAPTMDLNQGAQPQDAAPQPASEPTDAPHAGGLLVGGSIGGGQLRDKAVGVTGVGLEFHLGYFPKDWLGVVATGNVFTHQVDDTHNLSLYGGALLAEVHPLRRLWLAVGPGYYSLAATTEDKAAMKTTPSKSAKSFGAQADVGFDVYRPSSPRGLSTGLVFRTQLASFEGQAVFTTLGLLDVRYYAGGGPAPARPIESAAAGQEQQAADAPLSLTSSCGDPVQQVLAVLQLGGRPCAYRLGAVGVAQQLTSFAGRLLKGTSYGVWLGRLTGIGNAVRGLSVRYDAAQSTVQLLRHGPSGVTASGVMQVAAQGAAQRWRIARTPKRALIWLNDQLVANEDAPADGAETGLLTDGAQLELGEVEQAPLAADDARKLEALPAVAWPALATPSTVEPTDTAPAEPTPEAAPAEPHVLLLRDYYAGLISGKFDAARYFAPQVARYIGMRNTTPGAIQTYIDRTFPTQFRQVRFEADERSYESDGAGQFSYIEHAKYFNVGKGKYEKIDSLVRVRFDAQGKLTHLWQDKVLERSASDQPIP